MSGQPPPRKKRKTVKAGGERHDAGQPPPRKKRKTVKAGGERHDVPSPAVTRKLEIKNPVIGLTKGTPSEWSYYKLCLKTVQEKFLVTDSFREVVNELNRGTERIAIGGPKGVGKSLALAAIAELSRKKWPCLLWSSLQYLPFYRLYVKEVYKQYGKEFNVELSDTFEMVQQFALDFDEPIVLVELGTVSKLNKHDLEFLSMVLCFSNVRFVISRSSGNENFIGGGILDVIISRSCSIVFKPFEPAEVDNFFKICSIPCDNNNKEVYKNLTGGNPLLLSVCVGKNEREARKEVNKKVRKYVSSLVDSSLQGVARGVWINYSLPRSIEFLCSAYSGILIPKPDMSSYDATWIAAEGITYIKETTENSFTLALNFPSAYDVLMIVLQARVRSKEMLITDSSILGLLFEHVLCNELRKFHVSFFNQDGKAPVSATFNFVVSVAMSTAVKQLVEGTLYHLRPRHPVIDAVGYLVVNGQPWLLMVQVSISTYSNHTSKVEDLLNKIGKEEWEIEANAGNCLQYYCSRVPKSSKARPLKKMYIYISPEEFFDTGMPSDTLNCGRQLGAQKDFYVGLIQKSSQCANCVTTIYESLTHSLTHNYL